MKVKITYLLNSGFTTEINDTLFIFDYYQDPVNVVDSLIKKYKKVYFFASHRHFDHYNPEIFKFDQNVTHYILSSDIKALKPNNAKIIFLDEYDHAEVDDFQVKTYSSTDEGTCFEIHLDNKTIFHAGDFNWWHWKGDTENNILFARNGFKKQLKKFHDVKYDLAFFPVDGRLEEYMDLGIKAFAEVVKIKNLVTMHNVNGRVWHIPDTPVFNEMDNIFIPAKPGDVCEIEI